MARCIRRKLSRRKEDVYKRQEKNNRKYGLHKEFHPRALEALVNYSWPGNIRELSNIVERASMTCEGDVIPKDLLPQEVPVSYTHLSDQRRCSEYLKP